MKTSVLDDQKRFEVKLEEDEQGTYFFNSKDLNLIDHIQDLFEAGVASLKIEGRAKSVYYVSLVCQSYRKVIDALESKKDKKEIKNVTKEAKKELDNLVNRGYTKGFLLGEEPEHNFSGENNWEKFKFVGEIIGEKDDLNIVKIHNEISLEDSLEVIAPEGNRKVRIKEIYDHKKQEVNEAHGGHDKPYFIKFNKKLAEKNLLRKRLT